MIARPTIEQLRQPFIGNWHIVSAENYVKANFSEYNCLVVPPDGWGELTFDAMIIGLDFNFAPQTLFFDFEGTVEMDEVTGEGSMELIGQDRVEIELEFKNGDVLALKAVRTGD